jgi:hypothetical protein
MGMRAPELVGGCVVFYKIGVAGVAHKKIIVGWLFFDILANSVFVVEGKYRHD